MPDDGPAGVFADRRRVVVQALEDLGVTDDIGSTMVIDRAQQPPALDDRDLAAVLAGLRFVQRFRFSMQDPHGFLAEAWRRAGGEQTLGDVLAIAEAAGEGLDAAEIDALCERLNGSVR